MKAWLRLMYLMNLEENQGFRIRFLALNVLICYINLLQVFANCSNLPDEFTSSLGTHFIL